ncbi:Pycsar system effector family protein [Actinoplanes sp. CA-015351]|uniref:Pycsar system effector family protein n=1 Tax=Actinoplanes sp. CA-015351 TaxID=3239897 RepID=UPI003D97B661
MIYDDNAIHSRIDQAGRAALQQANELIRFADVKAAAVLAAAGVLASQLWTARNLWDRSGHAWTHGLIIAAVCAIALSALLALYTLVPRQQESASESLHHYRQVARHFGDDREGFVDAWLDSAADHEATERAVAAQIWAANLIANRKFAQMKWSIRLLVIGISALALLVLF